ncbi:MAG: hypothetical protein E6H00_12910 [Bacillati bacterium ANGP1]|uniref:HNH endonuclease n=1 Tax=Candidatus Segetimicrobium genomatis TaxID=2569760 RepID=A0A537JXQ6_9BACT|nr:MAG: hypothetical protein E6H00_12910 [Terrabacteria group bacterium ANGP1]
MDPAMVETWKSIHGFEGLYEVSDQARVRRTGRAAIQGKGHGGGARIGRILASCPTKKGYLAINLWKNGKISRKLLHVLVARAFIGPAQGQEVNHKDGIKTHCWLDNLEYLTRPENGKHAYRIGLRRPANLKMTAHKVRQIRSSSPWAVEDLLGSMASQNPASRASEMAEHGAKNGRAHEAREF